MKKNILLLTAVCAIPAFMLGRVIWPDPMDAPMLSSVQLAGLMFIAALEAVAFGLGISFIVYGRSALHASPAQYPRHRSLAFWSIAWTLVSWWPHDNMHRANGMANVWGLIRIEYIFHFTLIMCAIIISYYFLRTLRKA